MPLTAIDIYLRIFKIWRARRFDLFKKLLAPRRDETLVDVGGHPATWTPHPPLVESIDIIDVRECVFNPASFPDHRIKVMMGNGCHLAAADQSYDIAFSNSVIEHVGTWNDQRKFADELRRVGGKVWCQTPAWECPVEPHYMAPFIHWLPKAAQRRIIRRLTPWGWLSKPPPEHVDFMVNTTRLVSYREMKILFPDCKIIVERMFGILPKSYIAVRNQQAME